MRKQHLVVIVVTILIFMPVARIIAHPGESAQPKEVHTTPTTHPLVKIPTSNSQVGTHHNKTHYEKPMVLVHDVTPYYFSELREIIDVLDEYNYSNSTILFVIPVFDTAHYGDRWSLMRHPEFVKYLHELQKRGYRIELHGYAHTYHEFNCSYELASEKLDNATSMMSALGFGNMSLFLPPAWAINNESLRAILEHNLTLVMTDYMIFPNGSRVRIVNREYTWYINESQVPDRLRVALHDYIRASEEGVPFYLSIHPGVVNYGGGLEFLREFLREVETLRKS